MKTKVGRSGSCRCSVRSRYPEPATTHLSDRSLTTTIMDFSDTAAGVHYANRVVLLPMRHEANIRHPGEDWAGITNQRERKRLQNRLNKRVCE